MTSGPPSDPAAPTTTVFAPGSQALCLRCGAGRRLAFARCDACGHEPADGDDRAAHFLAMELPEAEREALARHIAAGGRFEPDPAELDDAREALDAAHPAAVAGFALLVGGIPLAVVMLLLFVLAWALLAL